MKLNSNYLWANKLFKELYELEIGPFRYLVVVKCNSTQFLHEFLDSTSFLQSFDSSFSTRILFCYDLLYPPNWVT